MLTGEQKHFSNFFLFARSHRFSDDPYYSSYTPMKPYCVLKILIFQVLHEILYFGGCRKMYEKAPKNENRVTSKVRVIKILIRIEDLGTILFIQFWRHLLFELANRQLLMVDPRFFYIVHSSHKMRIE